MISHSLRVALLLAAAALSARAQVIEFENNGLKYQSLTRQGLTIMCARLPVRLEEYLLVQVAISNGSDAYATIQPEDFIYTRTDGRVVAAASAQSVVADILERGNHSDLVKLVTTYENAIYAIPNLKLDNGYEKRRQAALAEGTSARFKAAAAASAIALIKTRVPPGLATDGAVFFPMGGHFPLGGHNFPPGRVTVHNYGQTWEFNAE
jgi:hypothetical protein